MRVNTRFPALLFAFSVLAAGCRGSGSAVMPSGAQSGTPGSASFSVAVPLVAGVPGMQSVLVSLIAVNGAAPANAVAPAKMNFSKSTPGCAMTAVATMTCTAKIAVPAGSDTFAVTTFAQPNQHGNQISNDRVTAPISAGRAVACVKKGPR